MENRFLKSWFFVLLIFWGMFGLTKNLHASLLCSPNGYTVLSINGIFTNEDGAKTNAYALKRKLSTDTFNNQPLTVNYLYNPTHLAGANDFIDAIQQGAFLQKSDYDLMEMLNDASQKVTTQKLLLVAHSQGNFYANNFYDKVASKPGGIPEKSVSVYGVASPAGWVAGGGKYLTSSTDNVINNVRNNIFVLPPNIDIQLKSTDGNGHSFSDVYLKYQGNRIVSDIKSTLNKLKENDEQEADYPCISPPELSNLHKLQGAAFVVADPTAIAFKAVAVNSYKAGAYVRDGTSNIGAALGKKINKISLSIKNVLQGMSANVIESLPDAGSIALELPNTTNTDAEENNLPKEEKKVPDNTETEILVPLNNPETLNEKEENGNDKILETDITKTKRHSSGSSGSSGESLPEVELEPEEELPPAEDPVVPVPDTTEPEEPEEPEPEPTLSCTEPKILVDNVCVDPDPEPIPEPELPIESDFSDLNQNVIADSSEEEVVVNTNSSLATGQYFFKKLTITNNALLTLESDETLSDFQGVKITANDLTINEGSSMSANNKGYMDGPGAPPLEGFAGANYGGIDEKNVATPSYGSALTPLDLGSGGTANTRGGGAIQLNINNVFLNDGTITANGDLNSTGGSIYIRTKNLEGNGKITANGGGFFLGSSIYAGGSGGRIAIYYQTSSWNGTMEAKGGCGSYDSYTPTCATDGTAGLFNETENDFYAQGSWKFLEDDAPFSFNKIWILNKAKVRVEKDTTLTAQEIIVNEASSLSLAEGQKLNVPTINIDGNSSLILSGEETINADTIDLKGNSTITVVAEKVLYLDVPNITIESGSSISANEKGYVNGPGSPDENYTAGASYGGKGGGMLAKSAYGSEMEPVDFGSGVEGRRGGGAVRIIAKESFKNDGIVSVNGFGSASVERASGGSIYVETDDLSGIGSFQSNGGGGGWPYTGLAGAGGRIAIYYKTSSFVGEAVAKGGLYCFSGCSLAGENGTVKIVDTTEVVPVVPSLSSLKEITQFNFSDLSPAVAGVINETAHIITLSVPFGTNLVSLIPSITVSNNASVSPNNNIAQDFTTPLTYTVTAEDNSTINYVVTVVLEPESIPISDPLPPATPDTTAPTILSYKFNDTEGNIMANPLTNPISLIFTASENVEWISLKIEKENNESGLEVYRSFQPGDDCDGKDICIENWGGELSRGGSIEDGDIYKIKVHIKDLVGNEFYDYLTDKIIIDII